MTRASLKTMLAFFISRYGYQHWTVLYSFWYIDISDE